MNRITLLITTSLLAFTLLTGCATQTADSQESTSAIASATASTQASDIAGTDEMFTDRDKEIGYSEADGTIVALADDTSTANGEGVTIENNTITISAEGTYILSGSLSNGQIVVDDSDDAKIQIVLNGVDISNDSSAALYIKNANKVFITTASGSENKLSVTGEYVAIDDNNIDATIFSKSDLTLNGAGELTIDADYGHAIVSKDDLAVTSGSYEITAASKALSGKNSVRIADGTFNIEAGTDGIHSENEDDTALGFVYIEGGTLNISAGDDGIHGGTDVTIVGGTIYITKSYEGIEAQNIDISGGDVFLIASDDGLNAAGGNDQSGGADRANMTASDCYINISGGTLTVDASGDGLDSNGSLTISGGTTTVSGPTNDGNGTIDYNGTAEITGGILLGAGSSGMAQGLASSSSQCSILYVLSSAQQAKTTVTLKDERGNVIVEFMPAKQFQSVNISLPELTQGSTYTLCIGTEEYSIELTQNTYSNSNSGMGGAGGGMGGGPGGGKGGAGGGPRESGATITSSATTQQ